MYSQYYGLTQKPFPLAPDPHVVFMSETHQEALAILRYGVLDRKGFLLLTGEVGTGKTTLLQVLVSSINTKVHTCLVVNPTLSGTDFYYYLAEKYGLSYNGNKAMFMIDFAGFLKDCREKKERVLLIIDEAHVMPVDLFEEIRLLSNQEYEEYGVLSIFLVGQPELNERLGHERLLPLRQRIGIRFHLKPFSAEETKKYIMFRLRKAGAMRFDIFSDDALRLIHKESKGIPRLINVLCDQALLSGFAEDMRMVGVKTVRECVKELRIPEGRPAGPGGLKKGLWRNQMPSERLLFSILYILLIFLLAGILIQIYYLEPNALPGGGWIRDLLQHLHS